MNKKEKILDQVSKKTNVKAEDIISLANSLQNKDLKNEKNLRDLIKEVSKLAGKPVSKEKEDKIIAMVKNDQVPHDLGSFM